MLGCIGTATPGCCRRALRIGLVVFNRSCAPTLLPPPPRRPPRSFCAGPPPLGAAPARPQQATAKPNTNSANASRLPPKIQSQLSGALEVLLRESGVEPELVLVLLPLPLPLPLPLLPGETFTDLMGDAALMLSE